MVRILPGLREASIVPDVTMVREAVGHEPQLALLLVLDDGVEGRLGVDLHLGLGPPGHLHHHVVGSSLSSIQRNVMEWGDWT